MVYTYDGAYQSGGMVRLFSIKPIKAASLGCTPSQGPCAPLPVPCHCRRAWPLAPARGTQPPLCVLPALMLPPRLATGAGVDARV